MVKFVCFSSKGNLSTKSTIEYRTIFCNPKTNADNDNHFE